MLPCQKAGSIRFQKAFTARNPELSSHKVERQFRILGPIEVELAGGRNAGVPRGRALSFLALLLVHRGAIVRLDRVVDELRGDAVLAVFGSPVAHEDDAQRALRAAAELGTRTKHLPFGLCGRSGVSTGDVWCRCVDPLALR